MGTGGGLVNTTHHYYFRFQLKNKSSTGSKTSGGSVNKDSMPVATNSGSLSSRINFKRVSTLTAIERVKQIELAIDIVQRNGIVPLMSEVRPEEIG